VSEALTCIAEASPDLILLDHVLERGERGADMLPKLKQSAAHVPIIMISGTLDIRSQIRALSGPDSAHYVLEKPVDIEELERITETALTECGFGEAVRMLQSLERSEKSELSEPDRRFTERLFRQHAMLKNLRSHQEADRPNISKLARHYNVSRRTIIRDLRELIQRGQLDAAAYPEWNQDLASEE
jgi:response regulator of citrate/malate metabolism